MNVVLPARPVLSVESWLNTPRPIDLDQLRGKVVVLYAFQMLCPGCVYRVTPVIEKLHRLTKDGDDVAVVGLHTVFEHHEGMGPKSLAAYLSEFGVTFPVGIDRHDEPGSTPVTMRRLGLRGTPSVVVLDRLGEPRLHLFGTVDEVALGLELGKLLGEEVPGEAASCDDGACAVGSR